jgi:Protein of unknown function (DUF2470)
MESWFSGLGNKSFISNAMFAGANALSWRRWSEIEAVRAKTGVESLLWSSVHQPGGVLAKPSLGRRASDRQNVDSMGGIIQHMNTDHKDALALLAGIFARIESTEAMMTTVDRLGFHVRLKTPDGMRGAHIAFSHEVRSAAETRKVWRHVANMYEIR